MIDAAQFPRQSLEDLVPEDERHAIDTEVRAATRRSDGVAFRGRPLDQLVEQSLMWFFRSGTLPVSDEVKSARDDFRVGAAIMMTAAPRLLDRTRPDVVVLLNGLFYEDRLLREEAIRRGIRVVSYEVGAQAGTLHFSDVVPAVDYNIDDLWEQEGGQPMRDDERRSLDRLLGARGSGSALSRRYYGRRHGLVRREGVPMVAVFTNVSWDTAVTGETFAFESMFDWVTETIRIADAHPELDFVIRAHPAESRWLGLESRERLPDFMSKAFTSLPRNVRVVPADEPMDSYSLLDAADFVAVYSSTVGLEAAARGKPVVVAGKAHYRGRGFTVDLTSKDEYWRLFNDLTWAKLDSRAHERARHYAYLFFCRAMIPFKPVVADDTSEPVFAFSNSAELGPGRDPDLDLVCDRILNGGAIRLH